MLAQTLLLFVEPAQQSHDQQPQSGAEVEALLRIAARAIRAGNVAAARSLLRALAREHPNDLRVWQELAAVAETADEKRQAREQVLALAPLPPQIDEPKQPASTSASPVVPATSPPPATDVATSPVSHAPNSKVPVSRSRSWLYLALVGTLLVVVLIVVSAKLAQPRIGELAFTPTPPLLVSSPTAVSVASVLPVSTEVIVTPTAVATPIATSTVATIPTASTPVLTATPTAVALPTPLPLGTLMEYDGWQATLLRPDYALVLEGSIGGLQPRGQFVLALLAVANTSNAPRRIPANLFALVDAQGRTYQPVPNASSVYLATYGRGQRGDLALEDPVEPGGRMFSIPLLFDVPPNTTGLLLAMGQPTTSGWQVVEAQSQENNLPIAPTQNVGP